MPWTGVGVPPTVTAVALPVTAVCPTAATFCAVYPTGTDPTVSNVNVRTGATAANAVVVKRPPSGQLTFRNNAGDVDLVADLAGQTLRQARVGQVDKPDIWHQTQGR